MLRHSYRAAISSTWRRRNFRAIQRSSRIEVMKPWRRSGAAAHGRCAAHGDPSGIEAKESAGVLVQELLAGWHRQRLVGADEAADLLLPEREGVVGTEHDAVLAHDLDQKRERVPAEHSRVDVEPVDVGGRQTRAVLAHYVAVAPGIVDAPEKVRKAAAAVREAQLERARQALEGARQDQPQDRQLRFRKLCFA